ncbi:unnamed protein product, partial [Ectocarpus sp. 12 AP-2014]
CYCRVNCVCALRGRRERLFLDGPGVWRSFRAVSDISSGVDGNGGERYGRCSKTRQSPRTFARRCPPVSRWIFPRLGSKNENRAERMSMTIFDDDRWLHLMSVGRMQQLLPIIDRIQAAMVASTFNSTADSERARHHFATHTLPCAVTAVMGRADLEKDNPAQVFLMHCIQFFLATLEMDNEALLEALRPVLLFRPQATQNHRLRPRTNGPYDFYVNNM